ncbi:MAG TPA: OsmC family protein [Rhodocyclaceae bacterium]|nr:OsmC family protein [Rhodocyclaceae bacterium]
MFSVNVSSSPVITVAGSKHQVQYAVDGSFMNPLEAFYATLAGCAAVYAKKACKAQGVSPDGIRIECKPFAGPGGPLTLARFRTEVQFPEDFPAEHKAAVIATIAGCAVKEIVAGGAAIEFSVAEACTA